MADRCLVTGRQQLPVAIAPVRCYRAIDGEPLVGCYAKINSNESPEYSVGGAWSALSPAERSLS